MAEQFNEGKKLDISSLPRGAIGIRGLPLNRSTRLPSFRTPRDLTLGSQPKRTFIPNIPVRREKRSSVSEKNASEEKIESAKNERKSSFQNDKKQQGRGRGRGQIIQTDGAIFGDGFAKETSHKEKTKGLSYTRTSLSHTPSERNLKVKEEVISLSVSDIKESLSQLFRDDFIDDECDEESISPIIFPVQDELKQEEKKMKKDAAKAFDHNVAQNMDFEEIEKFIKKEKSEEVTLSGPSLETSIPETDSKNLFNENVSQLLLLQFPSCVTTRQKNDENDQNYPKAHSSTENKQSVAQAPLSTSLSSLPEGNIGKLQLLKSGKIRLLLDGLSFDLDSQSPLRTKFEVASLRTFTSSGDLMVLGNIAQKLKFSSDIDSLLG